MSREHEKKHSVRIVDQFSKQAIPFTELGIHMDAIELLRKMTEVNSGDEVLDVACGPGLVACEFAPHVRHVTGLDITEAMIEQARKRQKELSLDNIKWMMGNAVPLPFEDSTFSLVIARYSFHHFLEPAKALGEMVRVCMPRGRVLVADVCVKEEHSAEYDRMEIMRDDSHVHALTENEFTDMLSRSGLTELKRSAYGLDTEVDHLLESSSHKPGDGRKVREIIVSDIGVNRLGINSRYKDGKLMFTFPIAVFSGRKE